MVLAREISAQTIKRKTGKSSLEWYTIIDQFSTINHTQIAKRLREEYKISPWWAQILTNRYEWERGLRNS